MYSCKEGRPKRGPGNRFPHPSAPRQPPRTPFRTEGGGHKPVFLQHFSGEAPGDSGASPREAASRLPDPLEQRTPGSGSGAAQGDGMASRWLAAYLQATTTRQKSQLSSERTNQVIVNNANCLVQAQLAGGARFRTVNPVVSYYPPVRCS